MLKNWPPLSLSPPPSTAISYRLFPPPCLPINYPLFFLAFLSLRVSPYIPKKISQEERRENGLRKEPRKTNKKSWAEGIHEPIRHIIWSNLAKAIASSSMADALSDFGYYKIWVEISGKEISGKNIRRKIII